mmetsp:Transcript_46043/g.115492  ORF Transcript_46043/g.115492 Transcript_46043/m.115492 type:complete len:206 (+) Transcript_46043:1660-2277(+)
MTIFCLRSLMKLQGLPSSKLLIPWRSKRQWRRLPRPFTICFLKAWHLKTRRGSTWLSPSRRSMEPHHLSAGHYQRRTTALFHCLMRWTLCGQCRIQFTGRIISRSMKPLTMMILHPLTGEGGGTLPSLLRTNLKMQQERQKDQQRTLRLNCQGQPLPPPGAPPGAKGTHRRAWKAVERATRRRARCILRSSALNLWRIRSWSARH